MLLVWEGGNRYREMLVVAGSGDGGAWRRQCCAACVWGGGGGGGGAVEAAAAGRRWSRLEVAGGSARCQCCWRWAVLCGMPLGRGG